MAARTLGALAASALVPLPSPREEDMSAEANNRPADAVDTALRATSSRAGATAPDVFDPHTRLARARAAHRPGSRVPHTVVVLPSYSVSMSLLEHYGPRIPALEHRQLLTLLMLPRVPGSEMIFVTATEPSERVLEYYLSFVPAEHRRDTRRRIRLVEVPDPTPGRSPQSCWTGRT